MAVNTSRAPQAQKAKRRSSSMAAHNNNHSVAQRKSSVAGRSSVVQVIRVEPSRRGSGSKPMESSHTEWTEDMNSSSAVRRKSSIMMFFAFLRGDTSADHSSDGKPQPRKRRSSSMTGRLAVSVAAAEQKEARDEICKDSATKGVKEIGPLTSPTEPGESHAPPKANSIERQHVSEWKNVKRFGQSKYNYCYQETDDENMEL